MERVEEESEDLWGPRRLRLTEQPAGDCLGGQRMTCRKPWAQPGGARWHRHGRLEEGEVEGVRDKKEKPLIINRRGRGEREIGD